MDVPRYPALVVRDHVAAWVRDDERIAAALVHGSLAAGKVTELSDVDLVVATAPGSRESVWAERWALSEQLLGAPVVEAHEVPHQRPYRWQARTANLCGLDLQLDDGEIEWWPGLAHEVDFLVDRVGAAENRTVWMATGGEVGYDVTGADDETWAVLSWVAGCLLHGRTMMARFALYDVLAGRIVPVTGRSLYEIDGELGARVEEAMPQSFDAPEVCRALRAAVVLYEQLVTEWAASANATAPRSAFRPAVSNVLDRLEAGGGTALASV